MAGVEEVRAGIALANEKATEGIAAVQHAKLVLEEAQQALATATQGSTQEEIQQVNGMLAQATESLAEIQGTINTCMYSTAGYVERL